MIPPLVLDVSPGSRVLDVCCAPGGKTFQLMEKNPNTLIANDISSDRLSRFYRNMYSLVPRDFSTNLQVRSVDARKFQLLNSDEINASNASKSFDKPFDFILLDAPCSGEGIINLKEPKSYRDWSLLGVKKYARLQAALLETAYTLLSKGGSMVYSTCTLNNIENEHVALNFIQRHPDISMCDLDSYSPKPLQDSRFLRVFPDSQYQGFFICRFKKS
jgi:16S rRNA (cytosine1407-C5)-methyltransferase